MEKFELGSTLNTLWHIFLIIKNIYSNKLQAVSQLSKCSPSAPYALMMNLLPAKSHLKHRIAPAVSLLC
jgi:hypothetical protein